MKKISVVFALLSGAYSLYAGYSAERMEARRMDEPIAVGEWNLGLERCIKYGQEHDIPVFAVWSDRVCGNCTSWGITFVSDYFINKRKTLPCCQIIFCYMSNDDAAWKGLPDQENSITYNWMWGGKASGWPVTKNDSFVGSYNLIYYPYFAFYWQSHKVDAHFEASKFSSSTSNGRADNVIKALQTYFPGWTGPKPEVQYAGGDFTVAGGSQYDRMEIAEGFQTTVPNLVVPLTRTNNLDRVYTNYLQAVYGSSTQTVSAVWTAGDPAITASVAIPKGMRSGERLQLILLDDEKKGVATNFAACVTSANSAQNPYWIGERTASALNFAEWTMDLNVATQKVRSTSGSAYTLVLFTGALWCPHCKGLERQVFNTSEFRKFAQDNHLALVCMDNPHRPTGDLSLPNGAPPTLLRHAPGVANSGNGRIASGAGYMTRHGILESKAEACLVRNHNLGYTGIAAGGFCPFGAARTGYPTMVLLNKANRIVGYVLHPELEYPWVEDPVAKTNGTFDVKGDNVARMDVSATMARLREAIGMAERGMTVYNTDSSTLPQTSYLKAGQAGSGTLSANHLTEMWCVTGAEKRVKVVLRGTGGDGPVSLSFYRGPRGAVTPIGETVSGTLAGGLTNTVETSGEPVWVAVRANSTTNAPAVFSPYTTAADPFRGYALSTVDVRVPGPDPMVEQIAALLREIELFIKEEKIYRLTGVAIPPEGNAEFISLGDDLYQAKVSGIVEVPLEVPPGAKQTDVKEFSYALFETVQIGFAYTEDTYPEDCGVARIFVERKNDALGTVAARVWLVHRDGEADPRRYALDPADGWKFEDGGQGTTNWYCDVTWAEGEDTPVKEVHVRVFQDAVAFGEQALEFELRKVGTSRFDIADNCRRFTAKLVDDDVAQIGVLAITAARPAFVRNLELVAEEGTEVSVRVDRQFGTDTRVTAYLEIDQEGSNPIQSAPAVWEHCDTDPGRWLTFTVPSYSKGSVAHVLLVPQNGIPAKSSAQVALVKILPRGLPACTSDASVGSVAVKGIEFSRAYDLADPAGGILSVEKTTGSLPSGLVGKMIDGAFVVSGVPQSLGRYAATYRVVSDREGTKVSGATFDVEIEVLDMATAAKEKAVDIPEFTEAKIFENVVIREMVPENEVGASDRVWGLLNATLPASGRASAKLACEVGTFSYAAESWTKGENGQLETRLHSAAAQKTMGGTGDMAITVNKQGFIVAELDVGAGRPKSIDLSQTVRDEDSVAPWVGAYSVQMPQILTNSVIASGDAYLSLRLVSGASGRMTYAGTLPNGRAVSGSSLLLASLNDALLPFFCRAEGETGHVFSGLLRIQPNGLALLDDTRRCVTPELDGYPRWDRRGIDGNPVFLNAFGSVYDGKIVERCAADPSDLLFGLDGQWFASGLGTLGASLIVGVDLSNDKISCVGINPYQARFSFSKETGVVSGSFNLPIGQNSVATAFRGILMPGWASPNACDDCTPGRIPVRPVLSGSCWFTEPVEGVRRPVPNGCGVWLDGHPEE